MNCQDSRLARDDVRDLKLLKCLSGEKKNSSRTKLIQNYILREEEDLYEFVAVGTLFTSKYCTLPSSQSRTAAFGKGTNL